MHEGSDTKMKKIGGKYEPQALSAPERLTLPRATVSSILSNISVGAFASVYTIGPQ